MAKVLELECKEFKRGHSALPLGRDLIFSATYSFVNGQQ